jgi:hypothetical protein
VVVPWCVFPPLGCYYPVVFLCASVLFSLLAKVLFESGSEARSRLFLVLDCFLPTFVNFLSVCFLLIGWLLFIVASLTIAGIVLWLLVLNPPLFKP